MRIKLEDLSAKVTETILAIRAGVEAARNQGVIAELPDKVDFQVEVITGYKSLEEVEAGTTKATGGTTQVSPERRATTVRTGGGQTSTESVSGSQNDSESGSAPQLTVQSTTYGYA